MTWNLWWRFGPWRQREHAIVATIAAHQPDIVGLQEVWITPGGTQAAVIGERLGMSAVSAVCRVPRLFPDRDLAGSEAGIGVAVLSRWPVHAVSEHPLPSSKWPPPVALVVTVDHPDGPLHVATTTLDWEPSRGEQRHAQTTALAALLGDPALDGPLPVLLAGGLNAQPGTPEIRPLSAVMKDLWVAGSGVGGGQTFSSRNPFIEPDHVLADTRIDYLFARPGRSTSALTVPSARLAGTAPVAGVTPSDHHAVVADVVPSRPYHRFPRSPQRRRDRPVPGSAR